MFSGWILSPLSLSPSSLSRLLSLCLRLHAHKALHMCTFLIQFDVINILVFDFVPLCFVFFFAVIFYSICLFCCLFDCEYAARIHACPLCVHGIQFGKFEKVVVRCTCKLQTNRGLLIQSVSIFALAPLLECGVRAVHVSISLSIAANYRFLFRYFAVIV